MQGCIFLIFNDRKVEKASGKQSQKFRKKGGPIILLSVTLMCLSTWECFSEKFTNAGFKDKCLLFSPA